MGKVPKPKMTKITGIPAGNHGPSRPKSQVTHFTMHHIVGDAAAAIAETRKSSRQMSFSYAVGSDGKIYEGTGIGTVPYSDANYKSNLSTVSTEHAGGHSSVPYTEAMYKASIKLHAWLIDQLGNKPFKRHRDVSDSPTACPGSLNVERIAKEAKKLRDSYYKENDMLTKRGIYVLNRFYRGDTSNAVPTKTQIKKYVGKVTFDQYEKILVRSETHKRLAARAAKGDITPADFMPKAFRDALAKFNKNKEKK